jgi:hypothetical protein
MSRWSKLVRALEAQGKEPGILFDLATGDQVDVFARRVGLKRKRWWIFRESDKSYKARILEAEMTRLWLRLDAGDGASE